MVHDLLHRKAIQTVETHRVTAPLLYLHRFGCIQMIYRTSEIQFRRISFASPKRTRRKTMVMMVCRPLPVLGYLVSRSAILSSHCPLGLSPQWNKVVMTQSVRFFIPRRLSKLRFRVIGKVVPLGAVNCSNKSPRREKSRFTLIWTCSRWFIRQFLNVIEAVPGIGLKLKSSHLYNRDDNLSFFDKRKEK